MPIVYDPPLTGVFSAGNPVSKTDVSTLFGIVRDTVNTLELFLRDIGVWTVTAVAGTANAITGTLGWAEDADTVVLVVPVADNTGAVTLKLGTGAARAIQRPDGTALGAGDLRTGQPVMLRLTAGGVWRVVASGLLWSSFATALNDEATARINATRDTGVLPLANVAGTANAITADIAPALPGVTLSALSTVELIPAADNTGAVTLAVGGSAPWPVYRRDGTDVQAGDIKTNQSIWLRRRSNTWRMVTSANSEVSSAAALRSSQRRVASRDVTLSATEIVVKLPPGLNPTVDANTLIDILWPDAPWPVTAGTNITLKIVSSTGTTLQTGIARLDRSAGPGPRPGAWWTINYAQVMANDDWKQISLEPTQADVDSRAKAADMTARFAASLLGHRQLVATRDAAVTGSLRLVLPEEPTATERIVLVVPEDAPGPGLSITTPARTRTAGMMPNAAATVPTATNVQFRAGDILTIQVHDTSWFRIHSLWPGTRTVVDLQTRLKAAETEVADLKATGIKAVWQVDATLPTRPAAAVVYWHTYDDPTARMDLNDVWFQLPAPAVPAEIPAADWTIFNAMDGQSAILRLKKAPARQSPPVLRYEYRLNDGPAVAFPMTPGDTRITGLINGEVYGAQVRAVNFVGAGLWSTLQAARISEQHFLDDFNRTTGQKIGAVGTWTSLVSDPSYGLVILTGGVLGNSGSARTERAVANIYAPPDQYAQAKIVAAGDTLAWNDDRGIGLMVRRNATGGYYLTFGATRWELRSGSSGSGTFISGGTLDATQTYPLTARLEAQGTTLRVLLNGTVVWTGTDTTHAAGDVGIHGRRITGTAQLDDFRAGPLT